MHKSQCGDTNNMKKQRNMTPPKSHNTLITKPKDTEGAEVPDK
jgi:hypothetical protein